jgi:hypothetical protein
MISANPPAAVDAPVAFLLHAVDYWRRASERGR